ncbi:MFS transporter [Rhizobium sp. LjRoot98]|uniref:MFS transporter n=1 Tax=Rhizobium sp. LjRoot98 TaxID=3342345 RepID=UPI003ED0BB2D
MSNPYKEIFSVPGAKGFSAAGFLARLPLAMAPIGIVAMLSQTRGDYWVAGAVSATFALTNALAAPQISRLVDRFGQSAIIVPSTIVSVVAFALLILSANQDWPEWTLFASAFLAAAMPSMPAMLRARWTEIFRGRPELNTAFAFESAADELVYIAGASVSVGLAVSLFPEAGMLISTFFLALGTTAFVLQRSTEPAVRPVETGVAQTSAIRLRSVQIITLALIFVGSMFATAEVTTVAMTRELGQPGAASFVIGVYAIGSFVVGLILGALKLRTPLHRQLLIADTIPLLALAVFVSGIAISPTFITAFGLIERRVPESMLTEGITWVMTGIGIGMALGAFLAGLVVDMFGAQNGFWLSVAAGVAVVIIIALGQKILAGGRPQAAGDALAQAAE